MVSNIKNIYKDIKREKSSGQMHVAPISRGAVHRNNSAHSRTNSQVQNTPGAHQSLKAPNHLQQSAAHS